MLSKTDSPVTFVIMVIMLIFILAALSNRKFLFKMMLHPYSVIRNKEYYSWLSSDLVHNDFLHLLLNEIFMYLVCSNLEYTLRCRSAGGSWQFLIIYLGSNFAGVITATILNRNDFNYSTAGSSGSIFGCMISFMILKPHFTAFYLPFIGGVPNIYTAFIYGLIFIIYQRKSGNELINHEIHFFGACGGAAITFLLFYHPLFI